MKKIYYIIYDKIPNILFTHDFITSKIAEFNIASNFCTKCDLLLNYLINIESIHDVMYRSDCEYKGFLY